MKKIYKEYKKNGITKVNSLISEKNIQDIIKFIKDLFINFLKKKKIKKNYSKLKIEELILLIKKKFPSEYKKMIGTTMQRCPSVMKIGYSNKIIKILKSLGLKKPIFSTDPLIMFHSHYIDEKNYAPFHQDWRSIQGSLNNIVIWIPLVEIVKNMNSIEYIEQSHLKGLLNSRKNKWFRSISEINFSNKKKTDLISKGDAFLFSSFLVHKSGINTSKKVRISLQFRFNDLKDDYFIENGYPYPYEYAKPKQKLIVKNKPKKADVKKKFKL